MLGQIFEITLMNLKNLPSRFGSSAVIVVGIAGVVGVMVAILAMAAGFRGTLDRGGEPDRAIVLRGGSDSELSSTISRAELNIVASMEGVALAGGDLYTVADIPKRSTGLDANLIVRGVTPAAFELHHVVQVVEGRNFETGKSELIAGRGAHLAFAGIDIGNTLQVRGTEWTVVGIFEADGSAFESELWMDLAVAQSAFRRGESVTSMRVRVDSPARIAELAERVENEPRLDLKLVGEEDYFAAQSGSLAGQIEGFGTAIAIIMAIGALFAALNTMYSAVATRTVEIATLRALGFGSAPVVISVMIEAIALAILGGALGATISYLAFNGYTASTLNNVSFSQIAFDFAVTPEIIRTGLLWALGLGTIGGLFPAFRAAWMPITAALRGE